MKELHEKHEWYRDHQLHMTKEEKAEYQIFCSEKMMKIQVAKKRLNMYDSMLDTHARTLFA